MNCFNCGHQDVTHIAMYCSTLPQKFLRCRDPKCWAAARDSNEHVRGCSIRETCRPLSTNDRIHNVPMRFNMTTKNNSIKRFVPGINEAMIGHPGLRCQSSIAEDIEFEWTNPNLFEIFGPETMNFRILLVIDRTIVARFDIGYQTTNMLLFPIESQMKVEKFKEATKMNQTVAILSTTADENIEIETSDRYYRLTFKKADTATDELYVLAQYEVQKKNENTNE